MRLSVAAVLIDSRITGTKHGWSRSLVTQSLDLSNEAEISAVRRPVPRVDTDHASVVPRSRSIDSDRR